MQPQLETILQEFRSARDRLHRLRQTVPADRWPERAAPNRWSVAECVAHLNLTTEGFRPRVEAALAAAPAAAGPAPKRYRRDLIGWMLWKTMAPPVRFRIPTQPPFIPEATAPADELVTAFDRLQDEQESWVRRADGLPLGRIRVLSPFDPRGKLSYNLYSCLSILPRHQHRHLWQAEQVWAALDRGHAPAPR
jgi:hypothetical protein